MVKSESLSSDINLIKELEELKLKQKLLITSLNGKSKDELNSHLGELTNKIDFLVKIFTDLNSTDNPDSNMNINFNKIMDRLDLMESNFSEKISLIENKILDLNLNSSTTNSSGVLAVNNSLNSIQTPPPSPPETNFEVEGEGILDEKKEGKKKWF